MEDKQIIKLFFARADEAIGALKVRFGNTLYKIAMNILANHNDAEETTNDTYLAIWNAIPPKEPDPLAPYVYRTGRNMALKRLEYLSAEKRNNSYDVSLDELGTCLPDNDINPEQAVIIQEIADSINNFLEQDTDINRYIFMRRYWYGDAVEDIAKSVNMKSGAVSVRLNRIRTKLKEHLIKEGYYYEA